MNPKTTPTGELRTSTILIVDDNPANVRLLERMLENAGYECLLTTTDARQVRPIVEESSPDLILLDLHMPQMDGFAVLEEIRPLLEGVYLPVLVLTADVTRQAKERALSSGAKDFLAKPLDATEVLLRVHNLLETRFLHLEQRILQEQTLQGSIRALTEVLALVNPAGFSRALRARDTVGKLLSQLGTGSRWEVEIAALLSQMGSVVLPADLLEKHYYGKQLSHSETVAVSRLPNVASQVVAAIPRMEGVARILAHQDRRFDGRGTPPDEPRGTEIPWGARVLKVVLDLDALETRGIPVKAAMETIRQREGWYDPDVVNALAQLREIERHGRQVVEIEVREVVPGMVLAEEIRTISGMLLVARGQEVSEKMMERLRNSEQVLEPRQRVHVILPQARQESGVDS